MQTATMTFHSLRIGVDVPTNRRNIILADNPGERELWLDFDLSTFIPHTPDGTINLPPNGAMLVVCWDEWDNRASAHAVLSFGPNVIKLPPDCADEAADWAMDECPALIRTEP